MAKAKVGRTIRARFQRAYDLIRPQTWTRYTYAREVAGMSVPPQSETAACFCAVGAMRHVGLGSKYETLMTKIANKRYGEDITEVNDSDNLTERESRTRVRKVFRLAAKQLGFSLT